MPVKLLGMNRVKQKPKVAGFEDALLRAWNLSRKLGISQK